MKWFTSITDFKFATWHWFSWMVTLLCPLIDWPPVLCQCQVPQRTAPATRKLLQCIHYTDSHNRCYHWSQQRHVKLLITHSSVASPICQEGQSEINFPIFPLFPDFWLFFPIFPLFPPIFSDFSWFFPSFWQFFTIRGGTLPPLPPQWLRHWLHS